MSMPAWQTSAMRCGLFLFCILPACDLSAKGPKGEPDLDGDGVSESAGDCDDNNALRTPGSDETCDGIDNDCDNRIDDDPIDGDVWHPDVDGDGFGASATEETACTQPDAAIADGSDCDDTNSHIAPGIGEVCDTVDQDCDGKIDEDPPAGPIWYPDRDGDGAGDGLGGVMACEPPEGSIGDGSDCDDGNALIPALKETCNNDVDETCDGAADEGCPRFGELTTADADVVLTANAGDGAGSSMAVGDVTGDEVADILVAALGDDDYGTNYGAMYILGGPTVTSGTMTSAAIAKWYDGYGNPGFPNDVEVLGDGQGDGIADIGAISQGAERCWGAYGGDSLPTTAEIDKKSNVITIGASSTEPSTLATSHDWDGDGFSDLMCGTRAYDGKSQLFGVSMNPEASTERHDVYYFGDIHSISGVGDATGDGYDDVVVGTSDGAFLVSGGGSGSMSVGSRTVATYSGGGDDPTAGYRASSAGDLNADEKVEIAISSPYADGESLNEVGAIYIVDGSETGTVLLTSGLSVLHRFSGGAYKDHFGMFVTDASDHDGDGNLDLLVGSPDAGSGGTAWLFYGPWEEEESVETADFVVTGAASGDDAGTDVRLGQDVTGDGVPDIVMAAPGAEKAAGQILVFDGP